MSKEEINQKWSDLWPDFRPDEVLSPRLLRILYNSKSIPYSVHALDTLQEFRVILGHPIIVNHNGHRLRGGRHPEDILGLYGYPKFTFHQFCAFDISCPEIGLAELKDEVMSFGRFGGVGVYDIENFIHVDTRIPLEGAWITWES